MSDSWLDLGNSSPKFLIGADWQSAPSQALEPYRTIIQYAGTGIKIRNITDDIRVNFGMHMGNMGKAAEFSILDFFNARRGRATAFWFPIPKNIYTLTQATSLSSPTTLQIADTSPIYLQGYERMFMLLSSGDWISRLITGITASEMTINSSIGRVIQPSEVRLFGRLIFCRFDQDEIELKHTTPALSECDLSFGELPKEYPVLTAQTVVEIITDVNQTTWSAETDGSPIGIEAIAGGGGGGTGTKASGGGGGEYCKSTIAYVSGTPITIQIGQGGAGAVAANSDGDDGTDSTWDDGAHSVIAKAGLGSSAGYGGEGGTGDVDYGGGNGGYGGSYTLSPSNAGGGGGAGGPQGDGNIGANGKAFPAGGGGGGGNGGGSPGTQAAGDPSTEGGDGGDNINGVGHGSGALPDATPGTLGGGGGGGISDSGFATHDGGNGGDGSDYSGGGGGGSGSTGVGSGAKGGNGGLYGGGGGGAVDYDEPTKGIGGNGSKGCLRITYKAYI